MYKYKYKHKLLGGCNGTLAEKELAKRNISAKVSWNFPILTIACNRKNVKDIQKTLCIYRRGEPIAYKDHLYGEG